MFVCVSLIVCVFMFVCVCVCVCVGNILFANGFSNLLAHSHKKTHKYSSHIHKYTHAHTHIYMYIYTYIRVHTQSSPKILDKRDFSRKGFSSLHHKIKFKFIHLTANKLKYKELLFPLKYHLLDSLDYVFLRTFLPQFIGTF